MSKYKCNSCGGVESDPILTRRKDMEYQIDFSVNYSRCSNPHCHHIQAFPNPDDEKISTFYQKYTTHHGPNNIGFGKLIFKFSQKKIDRQIAKIGQFIELSKGAKILDFGAGSGAFLGHLSRAGYENVVGFDFDQSAVSYALSCGHRCYSDYANVEIAGGYDVIFMNHVIEHLPNPRIVFNHIYQLLNPNGCVVIRTPNADSYMSKLFKDFWRGWETPRHLNIFNSMSLRQFLNANNDFAVLKGETSNDMALQMAISSCFYQQPHVNKFFRMFSSLFVYFKSFVYFFKNPDSGEELFFIIKKVF